MKLYYFTGPDYALENVARRRLKISFPDEVNDVFEMMPFDFGKDRATRTRWRKSIKDHSKSCGFISFTEDWDVPTMWGHYAQSHKGVCYGFEVGGDLLKMNYEEKFAPFSSMPSTSAQDKYRRFRYAQGTKSKHWEYENEWRMFLKLSPQDQELKQRGVSSFFTYFGEHLKLEQIIIGAKSNLKKRDFVKALKGYGECQIIRARPSFRDFKIVEHLNYYDSNNA